MPLTRRFFLQSVSTLLASLGFGGFRSCLADSVSSVPSVPVWSGPEESLVLQRIFYDPGEASETLKRWTESHLFPLFQSWYPKIGRLLPGDGFLPPREVTFCYRPGNGVAFTSGTTIVCFFPWFEQNIHGESAGAAIHELVHVVQQYPPGSPSWLVEGLTDYIRWFLFEPPQLRPRVNFSRAKVTDSYRTTGAFLDFVIREFDPELLPRLNQVLRQNAYTSEYWSLTTGRTLEQLWVAFRDSETSAQA